MRRVGPALPGRMSCFPATHTWRRGRGFGRGTLVPLAYQSPSESRASRSLTSVGSSRPQNAIAWAS